jgi:HAD superfamily hydrolase (TIGR01509 family)
MIKAIFFDNDGVLVDTEKYFYKSTKQIMAKIGINLSEEEFINLTLIDNRGAWKYAREKNISEEGINELRNERDLIYSQYLLQKNLIMPGVDKALKRLHEKYKLGIVTSSKRGHFDIIHKFTNILHYFDFVLTIEDYARSKPAPDPYLKAVEMSGCLKEECIVVEDSERGLIAANEAGLKCIIIPNELTICSDFSKAWKVLENIENLVKIL